MLRAKSLTRVSPRFIAQKNAYTKSNIRDLTQSKSKITLGLLGNNLSMRSFAKSQILLEETKISKSPILRFDTSGKIEQMILKNSIIKQLYEIDGKDSMMLSADFVRNVIGTTDNLLNTTYHVYKQNHSKTKKSRGGYPIYQSTVLDPFLVTPLAFVVISYFINDQSPPESQEIAAIIKDVLAQLKNNPTSDEEHDKILDQIAKALKIANKITDPKELNIALLVVNLAYFQYDLLISALSGDPVDMETINNSLDTCQEHFNYLTDNYPDATSLENYGDLDALFKMKSAALYNPSVGWQRAQQAVDVLTSLYGEDDPKTITASQLLGYIYLAGNQPTKALPILKHVYEIRKQLIKPDANGQYFVWLWDPIALLTAAYCEMGELKKGKAMIDSSLNSIANVSNLNCVKLILNSSQQMNALGKFKAAQTINKGLEKILLKGNYPADFLFYSYLNSGRFSSMSRLFTEAINYYDLCTAHIEKSKELEHKEIKLAAINAARANMYATRNFNGDYEIASKYYVAAINSYKEENYVGLEDLMIEYALFMRKSGYEEEADTYVEQQLDRDSRKYALKL